ncbi:MAG: T9SS type A sorting domain-containing protein [Flavobacteriales bacterium]
MFKFSILIFNLLLFIGASSQSFVNTGTIGGSFDDAIRHVAVLENGDVVIAGTFQTTADLYPGPLVASYTSIGQSDIFLGRFSETGILIWMKTIGSTGTDDVLDLEVSNSTIIIAGYFNETINFDPTGNGALETSQGVTDGFIAAYDLNGDYIYHQVLAGPAGEQILNIAIQTDGSPAFSGYGFSGTLQVGNLSLENNGGGDIIVARMNNIGAVTSAFKLGSEFGNSLGYPDAMAVDSQNNIIIGGSFSGQIFDFDPGDETQGFSASSDNNAFVASYASDNSFNWVKPYGFGSYETVDALVTDEADNIYLFGEFSGQISFDSNFPMIVGTPSVANVLVAKLNADGLVIQVGQISGTSQFKAQEAIITPSQNIYIGGYYDGVADIDPLEGISTLGTDNNSGFIIQLNTALELVNGESVGIGSTLRILDIAVTPELNVLAAGFFLFTTIIQSENENTELTSTGGEDGFITMLFQDLCSDFIVSLESIVYPTCANPGAITMSVQGGTEPYTIAWSQHPDEQGFTVPLTTQCIETVTVSDANGCSRTSVFVIPGPTNDAEVDVIVNLSHSPFRLGQTATIDINVYNQFCDLASGVINLDLGPFLTIVESNNEDYTQEGTVVSWNYSNLTFDSGHILIRLFVLVSPDAGLGSEITISAEAVEEAGMDVEIQNNSIILSSATTAAYDPNDKQVFPQGVCDPQWTLQPEEFTYTIRFQNLGNAPAQNIFIYDTLSVHLNPNSIVFRGASPFDPLIEIIDENILKFSFINVYLPDSTSDAAGSIGYVIFDISPFNPDLADNTTIENKAGIVFDMNEPIITNNVLNTIVDEIPVVNDDILLNEGVSLVQDNASYTWFAECDEQQVLDIFTQSINSNTLAELGINAISAAINYQGCPTVITECLVVVSNEEIIDSFDWLVYPNPSNGNFRVETKGDATQLEIFEISGRKIYSTNIHSNSTEISLSIGSGIYLLKATNDKGQSIQQKIIIE